MPKERLTDTRIANWKPVKEAWLRDTESHLAVRARTVRGGLSKVFIFVSTLAYKEIRITIGEVGAVPLPDAKAKAFAWQKLVDEGRDPREVLREEEEAREAATAAAAAAECAARAEAEHRQRHTLRALCDAYVAALVRAGKVKSASAARSLFKCHLSADTGGTPASEVTAHQIAAAVRKVREAGKERAAGVLRSYLSAAFNAAKRAPFDSALPADLIPFNIEHNPVDAIPAIAVRRGVRNLTADELRAYLKALGNDLPDQALKLALYAGGQRMAQVLRAKVSDYDADTRTLRLWDGKGKRQTPREHLLPLAPKAAALVSQLAERARTREKERADKEDRPPDNTDLWLFSTYGRVAMTAETVSNRAAEICADMGGEPFDLRDIRRTVETMLAALRISKDIRGQLMSHGISGVQSAHYDRHSYTDEKLATLAAWETRLDAIEKGSSAPANVVQLPPAA